jgi:8-oxo-dGTP diphosphatase
MDWPGDSGNGMKYRKQRMRAALITRDPDGRVLLLQHERAHGRYWVLPGGGVDQGESIEDALVREMREELGTDCTVDRLVAVGELILPERHVIDFFLTGTLSRRENFNILWSEGISDFGWFHPDELAGMRILPAEIIPVLAAKNGSEEKVKYLGKYRLESQESVTR